MSFRTIPNESPHHQMALVTARWLTAWLLAILLGFSAQSARAAAPLAQPAQPSAAPSYGALANLLENKQSRDALIKQLRTLAAKPDVRTDGQHASPAPTGETADGQPGFLADAGGMVSILQSFTVSLSRNVQAMADMFSRRGWVAGAYVKGLDTVPGLLAVFASTIMAFFLLRACAALAYRRLDGWVSRLGADLETVGRRAAALRDLYRKMGAIVLGFLIDLAAVLLAAAVGYGVVLYVVARHQSAQVPGAVFASAFLAVEATCALARVVFATRYPDLRLIRMSDGVAGFWNAWLARLIRITGYGLMVAVPVAQMLLLPAAGRVLSLLIMLGVYVYAVRVIWSNRHLLRARMMDRAADLSAPLMSTLLRVLARVWHVLGIAYFTELLIASQVNPEDALPFMARATIQTLIAVGAGVLLSMIVTSLLSRRICLSGDMRARLPMLENRINAYVPAALRATRLFVLFVVALVVLDAWHAFNLPAWVASASGRVVLTTVVRVVVVLLVAAFVWTVVASIIESRLSGGTNQHRPSDREKTLLSLFRNASLIVIVTLAVLVVLSQIGIDIGPLIAGAGVVGLAIGFGAQKLVQDVITGVFIQLENGMNQNDVVELAGLFGTVEKITIRSVVVRTLDGGYHLIPFSTVDKLTNHTRDFGYHYGEYNVGHREDADNVIAHLEHAFDELMQDSELAPYVMERISIPGVTSLSERGFTVRVLIKTAPGMQWMIQRGFNRLVKKHFDAADIEIPYPHSVVQFEGGRDGGVVPLRVRMGQPRSDGMRSQGSKAGVVSQGAV